MRGVSTGQERLNLDEKTLADAFKAAGYATGAFGKWHNGTQYPYHPNGRGFDEFYGFCSGHWATYFNPPLEHNGHLVQGHGYITDDLADHAMQFIADHKDRPFFCYVPFNTPHEPMQVPDRFYAKFAHLDLKMRARDAATPPPGVSRPPGPNRREAAALKFRFPNPSGITPNRRRAGDHLAAALRPAGQ